MTVKTNGVAGRKSGALAGTLAAPPNSTTRSPTSPKIYADQNERDYTALQAAVKNGKAEATTAI